MRNRRRRRQTHRHNRRRRRRHTKNMTIAYLDWNSAEYILQSIKIASVFQTLSFSNWLEQLKFDYKLRWRAYIQHMRRTRFLWPSAQHAVMRMGRQLRLLFVSPWSTEESRSSFDVSLQNYFYLALREVYRFCSDHEGAQTPEYRAAEARVLHVWWQGITAKLAL